jgi:hypothetical protein
LVDVIASKKIERHQDRKRKEEKETADHKGPSFRATALPSPAMKKKTIRAAILRFEMRVAFNHMSRNALKACWKRVERCCSSVLC